MTRLEQGFEELLAAMEHELGMQPGDPLECLLQDVFLAGVDFALRQTFTPGPAPPQVIADFTVANQLAIELAQARARPKDPPS